MLRAKPPWSWMNTQCPAVTTKRGPASHPVPIQRILSAAVISREQIERHGTARELENRVRIDGDRLHRLLSERPRGAMTAKQRRQDRHATGCSRAPAVEQARTRHERASRAALARRAYDDDHRAVPRQTLAPGAREQRRGLLPFGRVRRQVVERLVELGAQVLGVAGAPVEMMLDIDVAGQNRRQLAERGAGGRRGDATRAAGSPSRTRRRWRASPSRPRRPHADRSAPTRRGRAHPVRRRWPRCRQPRRPRAVRPRHSRHRALRLGAGLARVR